MKLWFYVLVCFLASAVLAHCLTPLIRILAIRWGALDVPSERKPHERAIPTMGGAAIFLAFFIALFCIELGHVFYFHRPLFLQFRLHHLFFGALPLVLIGILDDRYRVNYKWKLVFQILSALIIVYFGYQIGGITHPFSGETIQLGVLSVPVTLLWFLFIINAINFMDGIDGLAAGVSLIALMTLFAVSLFLENVQIALLSILLVGSLVGFFRYNFYPASIFMGDTGSLFLGFLIAFIALCGAQKSSTAVALAIPIVILGLPILDAIFAVMRRWSSEWMVSKSFSRRVFSWQRIFYPDLGHIHHRLLALGFTKPQVVALLYLVALGFGFAGFALTAARYQQIASILFYMMFIFFIAFRKFPVTSHHLFEVSPSQMPIVSRTPTEKFSLNQESPRFGRLIVWAAGAVLPLFVLTVFLVARMFWK